MILHSVGCSVFCGTCHVMRKMVEPLRGLQTIVMVIYPCCLPTDDTYLARKNFFLHLRVPTYPEKSLFLRQKTQSLKSPEFDIGPEKDLVW